MFRHNNFACGLCLLIVEYGFDQQGWYGMFVACGIWCLIWLIWYVCPTGDKHTISTLLINCDPHSAYSPTQKNSFFSKLVFEWLLIVALTAMMCLYNVSGGDELIKGKKAKKHQYPTFPDQYLPTPLERSETLRLWCNKIFTLVPRLNIRV